MKPFWLQLLNQFTHVQPVFGCNPYLHIFTSTRLELEISLWPGLKDLPGARGQSDETLQRSCHTHFLNKDTAHIFDIDSESTFKYNNIACFLNLQVATLNLGWQMSFCWKAYHIKTQPPSRTSQVKLR